MDHIIHLRMGCIAALFVVVFVMLSPIAGRASAQEVVIVANKSLGVSVVSADDLASIFLGKMTTWPSGEAVAFAVFNDSEIQKEFLLKYIQKNPSQFKNYWKKLVFTGKGQMPPYMSSKEEILDFVNSSSGAVSFLPAGSESGAKILTVK